jgi:hypothetical protein
VGLEDQAVKTGVGLGAILVLAAASSALAASPCDYIRAFARQLPPTAWKAGDKALAPALVFDEFRSTNRQKEKISPLEASLATRADVLAALNDDGGQWTVFVDRLAGGDLYALSSFQGTLHCQGSVFVEAPPGHEPRIVDGPPGSEGGDGDMCWTNSAGFARVLGQPVWVDHDQIWGAAEHASFDITPRRVGGWGETCHLDLKFTADFVVSRSWCRDASVCAAAERIARGLVTKYQAPSRSVGAEADFTFGPPAPKTLTDRVKALAGGGPTFDFPATSSDGRPPLGFNEGGPDLFPLQIAGRWYIAGVHPDGVGWRTDEITDFAVYDLKTLAPLAAFPVKRILTGLASAKVGPADKDEE